MGAFADTSDIRHHPGTAFVRTEAEERTLELHALHLLAQVTARVLEPRKVLEQALATLTQTSWFRCGEAYLLFNGKLETIAVGLCRYSDTAACPLRPQLVDQAHLALAEGQVRQVNGWHIVPVDGMVALALAGGKLSRPFLEGVVSTLHAALERARLYQELAEKEQQRTHLVQALLRAQEEERARISRDLHDQVGQALTGILLGLEASLTEPHPERLQGLKELTCITLADVRRLAFDLRPAVLDELGLEAALRRYARELGGRSGLMIEVVVHRLPRLAHDEETVLYRVAQEALTNVVRHAQARRSSVVLTVVDNAVRLVIEDDGLGFDPTKVPSERLGLAGMRERVELQGGNLYLESTPGMGTTVCACLPAPDDHQVSDR